MATMNISLPDQLKAEVEAEVATGAYANASDFIRALIRGHGERRAQLIAALIEGEQSGTDERSIQQIVADGRRRAGL